MGKGEDFRHLRHCQRYGNDAYLPTETGKVEADEN